MEYLSLIRPLNSQISQKSYKSTSHPNRTQGRYRIKLGWFRALPRELERRQANKQKGNRKIKTSVSNQ